MVSDSRQFCYYFKLDPRPTSIIQEKIKTKHLWLETISLIRSIINAAVNNYSRIRKYPIAVIIDRKLREKSFPRIYFPKSFENRFTWIDVRDIQMLLFVEIRVDEVRGRDNGGPELISLTRKI